MVEQTKILFIVEDAEILSELYTAYYRPDRVIVTLPNLEEAYLNVEKWVSRFDLVIIEENGSLRGGVNLMLKAHQTQRSLPVIIVTREEDPDGYLAVLRLGATNYLVHPFNSRQIESLGKSPIPQVALTARMGW